MNNKIDIVEKVCLTGQCELFSRFQSRTTGVEVSPQVKSAATASENSSFYNWVKDYMYERFNAAIHTALKNAAYDDIKT